MSNKRNKALSMPMRWLCKMLVGPRYLAYTIFLEHRKEGESYARAFSALYFLLISAWMLTAALELPTLRDIAVEAVEAIGMQYTGRVSAHIIVISSALISVVVWWRKSMFDFSLQEFEKSDFVKNPHAAVIYFFFAVLMAIASGYHPYGAIGCILLGLWVSALYARKKCGVQDVN
jgi:uncharacterized membrane protein YwzB